MSVRLAAARKLVSSAANGARKDAEKVNRQAAEAAERAKDLRNEAKVFDAEVQRFEAAEAVLSSDE